MSFTPSLSVGQTGLDPSLVVVTDNSVGSDVLITSRLLTITDNNGDAVVPAGNSGSTIAWAWATNPISNKLLSQDASLTIRCDWLDAGGVSLYNYAETYPLLRFNKNKFVYLIQQQALKPNIVQDKDYWNSLCQYYINIIGAVAMVEDADDISGSQNCINRATFMLNNEAVNF